MNKNVDHENIDIKESAECPFYRTIGRQLI